MALALLFEDNTVLFMDAVKNYNRGRSASLTQHRVDKSGSVADHYAKDNREFSVKGIVSSADFQTSLARGYTPDVEEGEEYMPSMNKEVSLAVITSESLFGAGQVANASDSIFGRDITGLEMDPFRGLSHEAARDKINYVIDNSQSVTLIDADSTEGGYIRRYPDLYITNFSDSIDATSGDALYFDISFKKARYTLIREVDVSIKVATTGVNKDVADAAAGEVKKGNESVNEGDKNEKTTWQTTQREAMKQLLETGGFSGSVSSFISKIFN